MHRNAAVVRNRVFGGGVLTTADYQWPCGSVSHGLEVIAQVEQQQSRFLSSAEGLWLPSGLSPLKCDQ